MSVFKLIVLSSALLLVACQKTVIQADRFKVLKQSNQCRVEEPQMRILDSVEAAQQILGSNRLPKSTPPSFEVDFASQWVVLLAMGQKSTAGYAIEMTTDSVQVQGGVLRLPVRFASPSSDMAATVMTSPCAVLTIDKGDYRRILARNTGLSVSL